MRSFNVELLTIPHVIGTKKSSLWQSLQRKKNHLKRFPMMCLLDNEIDDKCCKILYWLVMRELVSCILKDQTISQTWLPITTICGSCTVSEPTVLNTSCSLLITGIKFSIFHSLRRQKMARTGLKGDNSEHPAGTCKQTLMTFYAHLFVI